MSKLLIISDLHLRHKIADQILEKELGNYDKVLYGGDFFDQFGDTPENAKEMAVWLKNKLDNYPNNIYLIGNHDFALKYHNNKNAYCSGFTYEKAKAVREILTQDDFDKLKTYHIEGDILFSHAGISKSFWEYMDINGYKKINKYTLENLKLELDNWIDIANTMYSAGFGHPLYRAGYDRGGDLPVGGIIWCDFGYHKIIKGINQIFFHTPVNSPTFKFKKDNTDQQYYSYADDLFQCDQYLKNGFSLNLDTHNNFYYILDFKTGIFNSYEVICDNPWFNKNRNMVNSVLRFSRKII